LGEKLPVDDVHGGKFVKVGGKHALHIQGQPIIRLGQLRRFRLKHGQSRTLAAVARVVGLRKSGDGNNERQ
jgi:hypothetical protein